MTMLFQLQIDSEKRNISYDDFEQVRQCVYHGQNRMAEIEEEWKDAHPPKDQRRK